MKKILIEVDSKTHQALRIYAAQQETFVSRIVPKILDDFVKGLAGTQKKT